jgi:hypothetical protein
MTFDLAYNVSYRFVAGHLPVRICVEHLAVYTYESARIRSRHSGKEQIEGTDKARDHTAHAVNRFDASPIVRVSMDCVSVVMKRNQNTSCVDEPVDCLFRLRPLMNM